jgi:hypothetical protein
MPGHSQGDISCCIYPARAQFKHSEIKEPKVEAGEIDVESLADYFLGQPRRRFLEEPPGSLVFDAD